MQRNHLHNCKLQYLYNSTAQESVKYFNRMVVMAPCRLPWTWATRAQPTTCALPVTQSLPRRFVHAMSETSGCDVWTCATSVPMVCGPS